MKSIVFKFGGGQMANFFNTPSGWLVVGDTFRDKDGTILLSCECHSVEELRERGEDLKRLIDEAIINSEKHLPSGENRV